MSELINGLDLVAPSSISYTGSSASINPDGSVSVNSVSAIDLNNVFSADYDSYWMLIVGNASADSNVRTYLLANGTPNTNTYNYEYLSANGTGRSAGGGAINYSICGALSSSSKSIISEYIFAPYLVQGTSFRNDGNYAIGNSSINIVNMNNATVSSYNGYRLTIPSSQTMTGKIYMYGFVQ